MNAKLTLVAALAACSHTQPTAAVVAPPPAAATIFDLGEITVYEGPQPVLKIHADGTTELGYRHGSLRVTPGETASTDSLPIDFRPGPTVTRDGTLAHGGKSIRINADGTFIANDTTQPQPAPFKVTADRLTVTKGGVTLEIAIAADGRVTMPGGRAPIRVEGADTAGKRRLALVFLALSSGVGEWRKKDTAPAE